MHSRVKPMETRVQEERNPIEHEHEIPSLGLTETGPNSYHGGEELLQAMEAIYKPVLTFMKLFGAYFGDASFKRSEHASSGKIKVSISRIYCSAVVAGLWFNFAMAIVSLFMEGTSVHETFYTLITFCMWYFVSALVITTCVVVLPLTGGKKSRFEKFVQSLIEKRVDLENLKSYSRKGLIIAICILIFSTIATIVAYILMPDLSVANYKPWNEWYGFRVISLVFFIYTCGIWILPTLFFCITCLVLERLFDCFCKRVASVDADFLDLKAIKEEHRKLCETLELAEKMFSPLLLEIISVYIPMLCFNFYAAINPKSEDNSVLFSVFGGLYWLLGSAAILGLITVFGARVNEKICSVQDIMQNVEVSDGDEEKLLLFLFYLNAGKQRGLSIGGLTVITKSLSLTIVGILVSYFGVMLTLPK